MIDEAVDIMKQFGWIVGYDLPSDELDCIQIFLQPPLQVAAPDIFEVLEPQTSNGAIEVLKPW